MTNEEIKALIKASRDWAKALPNHPDEKAISERLQDFFSLQDAMLLRAHAELKRLSAPPVVPKGWRVQRGPATGQWYLLGVSANAVDEARAAYALAWAILNNQAPLHEDEDAGEKVEGPQ